MAGAVLLSIEGGVFDRIGVLLTPAANAVASFLAWVLSEAARPIFWLVDRLGIDPDRVREFFESLRHGSARPGARAAGSGRAVDLAADARLPGVRRHRLRHVPRDPPLAPAVGGRSRRRVPRAPRPRVLAVHEPAPSRSRFRRELPADAVRRWYAEALLALRRARRRPGALATPTEFAPVVAEAVPASRPSSSG